MNMKVKDLIKSLEELPQDLVVITPTDDEGNGYRFIESGWVGTAGYNGAESDRDIEVGITELTPKLMEQGYSDEDVQPNKCVIIG